MSTGRLVAWPEDSANAVEGQSDEQQDEFGHDLNVVYEEESELDLRWLEERLSWAGKLQETAGLLRDSAKRTRQPDLSEEALADLQAMEAIARLRRQCRQQVQKLERLENKMHLVDSRSAEVKQRLTSLCKERELLKECAHELIECTKQGAVAEYHRPKAASSSPFAKGASWQETTRSATMAEESADGNGAEGGASSSRRTEQSQAILPGNAWRGGSSPSTTSPRAGVTSSPRGITPRSSPRLSPRAAGTVSPRGVLRPRRVRFDDRLQESPRSPHMPLPPGHGRRHSPILKQRGITIPARAIPATPDFLREPTAGANELVPTAPQERASTAGERPEQTAALAEALAEAAETNELPAAPAEAIAEAAEAKELQHSAQDAETAPPASLNGGQETAPDEEAAEAEAPQEVQRSQPPKQAAQPLRQVVHRQHSQHVQQAAVQVQRQIPQRQPQLIQPRHIVQPHVLTSQCQGRSALVPAHHPGHLRPPGFTQAAMHMVSPMPAPGQGATFQMMGR
eukprot:TRINITY_DN97733_c0_g1_i1.p1 TRINITY_DN97733_c0_g1~~TRINITY_DN97733_c0_g1_i1.p1  ORF type:complete len:512 (+),score=116.53 TRINITY_DN97733_c0_g1_i1:31-1566(+)